MNKLKIVYMGTPGFAVEPLRTLLDAGCRISAVVTAADKPQGRGMLLQPSDVKRFAVERSLPLMQPERLRSADFVEALRSLEADLFVVVAFRMLPEAVWGMPPLGTINLHASLLPDYRGAAPINHAVINGEKETGVTTFFIRSEIDTGEIIMQRRIAIGDSETAGELHDRLSGAGAALLLETVRQIAAGNAKSFPQPLPANLKPAPKLFRENCKIEWNNPAEKLRNMIRGLSPYPGAWGELNCAGKNMQVKIFKASAEKAESNCKPGAVVSDGKNYLKIACSDGFLYPEEIQLPGKKIMNIKSFMAGFVRQDG
ncbi:MAG: methionyl-tRNA formyltransferase [Prevotellaceae bacterium]|nr:methionyl-tRNA formyltransferase [Prevotellaceae bacterium]